MACKQHLAELKTRLKENNLKATNARVELLDVFEHSQKPLSVGDIAMKLPRSAGEVDRVTLYRNVEALQKLGLLKHIRFTDRQAYYELASRGHHHHLVCTSCGKMVDVPHCNIESLKKEILRLSGFKSVTDHSLEFLGICNNCK